MKTYALFILFAFGCDSEQPEGYVPPCMDGETGLQIPAEAYNDASGMYRFEYKESSYSTKVVHLGSDDDDEASGVGSSLSFDFSACEDNIRYTFQVAYSDDVGGNAYDVMMDGETVASFETVTTGGWEVFQKLDS